MTELTDLHPTRKEFCFVYSENGCDVHSVKNLEKCLEAQIIKTVI